MRGQVEIVFRDDDCAFGSIGNIFVSLTRDHQDMERLRQTRVALSAHFKRWGGAVGTLSVLEGRSYSSMVSSEERKEIQTMARDFLPRGAAVVIEGTGFRPAAMRGLLSG